MTIATSAGKTPEPLYQLFNDLAASVTQTLTLTEVAVGELARLDKTIVLMKAVDKVVKKDVTDEPDSAAEQLYNHSQRLSDALPTVETQAKSGFPFLHGLATIAIWSELEAYVEDIAVEMLVARPALLQVEAIGRLKASVSELLQLDGRERCEWVIHALQRDLAVGLRIGPGQFDPLLKVIGVYGALDEEVKASIVELQAVRNILVHRRGRVDERFGKCCPWISVSLNEEINVSHKMLLRYSAATLTYASEIIRRVHAVFGDHDDRHDALLATVKPIGRRKDTNS